MEKKAAHTIRYSEGVKQEVVQAIVQGDQLLEEVMRNYEIACSRTVIRWLKEYRKRVALAVAKSKKKTRKSSSSIGAYPEAVRLEVVREMVSGNLLLEEVMAKYGVKDRRTVVSWLKKYQREEVDQK